MHRPAQLCRCRCGVHQRLCRRKVKQGVSGHLVNDLRLAKGKEVERSQARTAAIEPSLRQSLWTALSWGGASYRSLHPSASSSIARCSLAPLSPAVQGAHAFPPISPAGLSSSKSRFRAPQSWSSSAAAHEEPRLSRFPPSSFFRKRRIFFSQQFAW